jgi:hypothetical protein
MFATLFTRASSIDLSKAANIVQQCLYPCRGGQLFGAGEARETGLSGPLVIRKPSPETEPKSLNDWVKCTDGLFWGILVIREVLLGLGGPDRDFRETQPPRALLHLV